MVWQAQEAPGSLTVADMSYCKVAAVVSLWNLGSASRIQKEECDQGGVGPPIRDRGFLRAYRGAIWGGQTNTNFLHATLSENSLIAVYFSHLPFFSYKSLRLCK
jgi:hypothetical protein